MIEGLSTTWCQVSDMRRSVAFYRDILGLKCEIESPYWSQFIVGSNKLGLHPRLEDSEDPLGIEGKGWTLGLQCDDLKTLRKALVVGGVTAGAYHQTPNGVVVGFTDPDGNPIQALQPGSKMVEFQ